jgi:hypothetical protein
MRRRTVLDCWHYIVPEGTEWTYEIKLDGYRLEFVKEASETDRPEGCLSPCQLKVSH